jgi:hypothetical protein
MDELELLFDIMDISTDIIVDALEDYFGFTTPYGDLIEQNDILDPNDVF